jgi:ABC-type transporter lipoprotein component MlaA
MDVDARNKCGHYGEAKGRYPVCPHYGPFRLTARTRFGTHPFRISNLNDNQESRILHARER